MNSLLLALALASPSFNGVVAVDGGVSQKSEGAGPDSTGARAAGRLGFAFRWDHFACVYEVYGAWIGFPEDGDGLSASGFEVGSGVRLGWQAFDVRAAVFGHLGVDGLFITHVRRFDDQAGRRTRTITRDNVGLGTNVGLALTYTGLPGFGVGAHGMWQTSLEIGDRRERLTAGLHLEVDL